MLTLLARFSLNPFVRTLVWLGVPIPGTVILETVGRRTGKRRRTPVTCRLTGDAVWFTSEHGVRAGYAHNIAHDPRVRVKVGRRWHRGTAHILVGENLDTVARRAVSPLVRPIYRPTLRLLGSDPTPVRVDLDT